MPRRTWALEIAAEVAAELIALLSPAATRIQLVGSVRRECPRVHDVDILLFERNGELDGVLADLGFKEVIHVSERATSHRRLIHCMTGIPVDLHVVQRMPVWWTLVMLMTGSKEFVQRVALLGKERRNITIEEDGTLKKWTGLTKFTLVEPKSERGVLWALGIREWIPPRERRA